MANEVSDEMIQYATDVCRKYNQIRTLAEDAEAAWRRNLEMVSESKYPVEEDMYKQEAEEGLVKYTAAREWIKLVMNVTFRIKDYRAQEVVRQHCLNKMPLKSVTFENGKCMGKTAVFYYKKIGMQQFSTALSEEKERLNVLEKKMQLI